MASVPFLLLVVASVGIYAAPSTPPTDDPVSSLYPSQSADPIRFTSSSFPWNNVVVVSGTSNPAKAYATAAQAVLKNNSNGGVVFFPAGIYEFTGDFTLVDRVVVRGESTGSAKASNGPKGPGPLKPTTKFEFPDRSFSRIICMNCTASGVVNVLSDGGGIDLVQGADVKDKSSMFVVLGNVLQHVVYKYPVAPPATFYQEWPYRFSIAVAVSAHNNAIIANNLLAKATKSATTKVNLINNKKNEDVTQLSSNGVKPPPPPPAPENCSLSLQFPYDNRYGIWHDNGGLPTVNVSIYGNYVHQNGRVGVMWQSNDGMTAGQQFHYDGTPVTQGSGVLVMLNHVEVEKGTTLWTVTGTKVAKGSDTNENRGYDQSGRSALLANSGTYFAKNTGNINRQIVPGGDCKPGTYETTDGEGILQQIQDGQVAERNIWEDNDLSFGEAGPMALYALHAVMDMTITGNKVNSKEIIGIIGGGSTPKNGTGISNLKCSGNTPPAKCK
eukprot:m.247131 g.247131  ORF g.247131 m.247131 type:complete len:498 (-) comp16125_c1_seq20:41-1534(-)